MSNALNNFYPRWRQVLLNPVWYVTSIIILTGLAYYLPGLWWLAGLVALVWGLWLVWQLFGEDNQKVSNEGRLSIYLHQAQVYQTRINQMLKATPHKNSSANQPQLAAQISLWVAAIQDLGQRIDDLRQDNVIGQDWMVVPQAIENLETQRAQETDAAIRRQLEHALTHRRDQLVALAGLQRTITQAEIQIENTLSLLGTIYSHLLTGQSTYHVADYGRLAVDIDEAVKRLQDQLEALQEVKGISGTGNKSR